MKLRRNKGEPAAAADPPPPDLDPVQLAHMFATPGWLRDVGMLAWLLVGVGVLLFGLVWFLGQISSIVGPVVAATIVAAVTAPLVTSLQRHMPRAAAAGIVLLALLVTGAVVALLVVGGIIDNGAEITASLNTRAETIQGWATDLGVGSSGATSATNDVTSAVPDIGSTLLKGVAGGIEGLTSVAFFTSFFFFSTFFLLKDGRVFRRFINRHLGIPQAVATVIIMLVLVLLAQGILQQIVQPIAFGATLDLNPLVVLIVTIAAGGLFGMVGLVLAAPVTSAAVHISRDLARARAAALESHGSPSEMDEDPGGWSFAGIPLP